MQIYSKSIIENFKNEDISRFLEIKSLFDRLGFVPTNVANMILEDRLNYQLQINKLQKQLLYALETGGEYLEIVDCLN